jgi:hypothetical protein
MARPRVLLLAARSWPEVVEVLDEIRTGIGKWAEAVADHEGVMNRARREARRLIMFFS